jgi:hypothetical protein
LLAAALTTTHSTELIVAASKDDSEKALEGDASEETARGERSAEVEGATAAASAASADFSSACLMIDMQACAVEPSRGVNRSIMALLKKRFSAASTQQHRSHKTASTRLKVMGGIRGGAMTSQFFHFSIFFVACDRVGTLFWTLLDSPGVGPRMYYYQGYMNISNISVCSPFRFEL